MEQRLTRARQRLKARGDSEGAAPEASHPRLDAVLQTIALLFNDYRRDFVTIAGLHALKPGSNAAGSVATNDIVLPESVPAAHGQFVLEGERVRFEPAPGAPVFLRGAQVTTTVALRDDGTPDADELVIGDVRFVVHVSGSNRAIRVRDPNGPLARSVVGFSWFPIDANHRVHGRLIRIHSRSGSRS